MIQIIDYNAGNLQSVKNALKRLDQKFEVISSPEQIREDAKLIFAGVGAAGTAMRSLIESGFAEVIPQLKNPFLGICLGMQVLFEFSEEDNTECLGVLDGRVEKFPIGLTVPHIGWNKVCTENNPLFEGVSDTSMYFVHSYYVNPQEDVSICETEYGITFCSAVKKDNFYGVQFHPEKSGDIGLKILDNFIKLC